MDRFKNYAATGIAPDGRLYAGDLNLFQDLVAALSSFTQTVDVSTLRVGSTDMVISKYGTSEFQVAGSLRTSSAGVLKGLGGLFAGTFTTTQRDSISSPLYGLVILNTTTNRHEWNKGTPSVPDWQPIADANGAVPIGTIIDWPYLNTAIPSNYLLCYGQAVSRTTYATLNSLASAISYVHGSGDGSTTFNLPDHRGRISVGKDDMGGTGANRVTSGGSGITGSAIGATGGAQNVSLATGELPSHSHGSGALGISGSPGVGSLAVGSHGHNISAEYGQIEIAGTITADIAHVFSFDGSGTGETQATQNATATVTGSPSAGTLDVSGTTDTAGSGTAHNNMPPVIVVNKIMRVL